MMNLTMQLTAKAFAALNIFKGKAVTSKRWRIFF